MQHKSQEPGGSADSNLIAHLHSICIALSFLHLFGPYQSCTKFTITIHDLCFFGVRFNMHLIWNRILRMTELRDVLPNQLLYSQNRYLDLNLGCYLRDLTSHPTIPIGDWFHESMLTAHALYICVVGHVWHLCCLPIQSQILFSFLEEDI